LIKPISECRCDERLKTKAEGSTLFSDTVTWFLGELENLKIKTRLIDEKFVSESCSLRKRQVNPALEL
jgi:hypothetical protein